MRSIVRFVLVLTSLCLLPGYVRAGLVVTLNNPGIQSTQVAGATTENFNSFKAGSYTSLTSSIGSYSSPGLAIVAPNQYGGSNTSNYMAIGSQSGTTSATLILNGAQSYFGMEWLAGDSQNILDFYSGGKLIAEFVTSSAFAATTHTGGPFGNGHYGNPNTNQNTGEPYGYLNFYATGSTSFDQIVFRNKSTGSGFESDNHSVLATQVGPPYDGTVISTDITGVPEPATLASAGSALAAFVGFQFWRRRRN
jgi:hypothetical protein